MPSTAGCCCCLPPCFWLPSRIIRFWPPSSTASSSTRRNGTEVFVGLDSYRSMFEDAIFWKALINNFWFAIGTVPTSIALALLMALWVNRNIRGRGLFAARILHSDGAADDRGRQHLAVLLHAGLRPARPAAWRVRTAGLELARRPLHRDGLPHRDGDLEGGRLLHDLLSGGASAIVARSGGGGCDRGRRPLVHVPARSRFRF